MSDPGQLVGLFYRERRLEPSEDTAFANEATNPFMAQPAAVAGVSILTSGASSGDRDDSRSSPAGAPAPSAIELQSLLLAVATAEGVSKLKTMGKRGGGDRGDGDTGDKREVGGSVEGQVMAGRVGEAAVEMLGRLTNQLLSR